MVRLKVRVIPNARKTEFSGFREGELVLRLNAPPVDGKANRVAVEFIARTLGVSRSAVSIVSGETSRHKVFEIADLDAIALESVLRKT